MNNSRYKSGTSHIKEFSEIRLTILKRDNYKCRMCKQEEKQRENIKGQMITNLVVHHINEDITDNTEENLITLCTTCHTKHHKSKTTPFEALRITNN